MDNELVLIRGLPGSGKSTLARSMADYFHVEADMFFTDVDNGKYKFVPEWLGAAHASCQRLCADALAAGKNVVVSNTFTQAWEMKPYFDMGHPVRVVTCEGRSPNEHGVPVEAIERMAARWEPVEMVHYIWEDNMFVTTKTHHAAIREKDEVIEGLMKRLSGHKETIAALNARFAPFERTRGKGGRFVKAETDAIS